MSEFDTDITPAVARALARVGVDAYDPIQLADVYAAGRWVLAQHMASVKHEVERENDRRERRARRWVWILAAVTLIVTPIVTVFVNYITRKL